jgi:putrescine transport system permease protein
VATLIIAVVAVGVVATSYFIARAERQRQREMSAANRS